MPNSTEQLIVDFILKIVYYLEDSGSQLCKLWFKKKKSITSLVAQTSKESAHNAGDPGSIPESRSLRGGNGNPLQYSCLENSMDRGACQATVHRVTKSQTNWTTEHTEFLKCFHLYGIHIYLSY